MSYVQLCIMDFPFYRLSQCSHQQLLYHSKYPVNIYHYKQTQQIFLVKQVPYDQKLIKFFRILKYQQTLNIVQIRGLSILKYVTNQKSAQNNHKNHRVNLNQELKNNNHSHNHNLIYSDNYDPNLDHYDNHNDNHKDSDKHSRANNRQKKYILIWMQKCGINLIQYVQQRRKKRQIFSSQQVQDFILQIITTLSILQSKGICHRDIKPQNILFNRGRYFLCDFDQCILTKQNKQQKSTQEIMGQIEYTTILYSTPKFLKALKYSNYRNKYFDPYKMDVYSFGLTLMYLCSLGRFNIDDRHVYIYSEDGSHEEFIQEERRKYFKKDMELKIFNNILKLTLQEDQYKRDDFVTLNMKIKNMLINSVKEDSQNSFSEKSKQKKREERQKLRKSYGKGFVFGKYKKNQKFLLFTLAITVLIYLGLLIF